MRTPNEVSRPFAVVLVAAALVVAAHARCDAACNTDVLSTATPAYQSDTNTGSIGSPFLTAGEERFVAASAVVDGDAIWIAWMAPGSSADATAMTVFRPNCNDGQPITCPGINTACVDGKLRFDLPPGLPPALRFTIPTTIGRAGPVRVAVIAKGSPPPCWLVDRKAACRTDEATHACIGALAAPPSVPEQQPVLTLTALPPPNSFAALCDPQSGDRPCKGNGSDLRMTIDANGDLLIPMDWSDLVRAQDGGPCKPKEKRCDIRDVTAETTLPAFPKKTERISIPKSDTDALASFDPLGGTFADRPEFHVDDTSTDPDALALAGTVDEPASVLRIRRCSAPSQTDGVCPSGATAYFDLRQRAGADGLIVVPRHRSAGRKVGLCDGMPGTECSPSKKCPEAVACLRAGGEARGFHHP